ISNSITHPQPNFGNLDNLPFGDLDPDNKYIISTRVRVGRSLEGRPFPPLLSKQDRLDMENVVKKVFSQFTGDHAGKYYALSNMSKEVEKQLVEDHFLFQDDNRLGLYNFFDLRTACGYNHWPAGRGIYHNDSKTFLIWVNEEDHLRIISMQKGGNLSEVYRRLIEACLFI
ncbi:LOW QUALITY PROTEIN: arginine kinase-like, partial [Octopus sinensis]|uniref:LOW QUALITY PROTEIN: arginine kinase-like n=1 Tax=Octopus sinensis TaxID=2607531 RepID=A0A7E6EJQ1_9MOLL